MPTFQSAIIIGCTSGMFLMLISFIYYYMTFPYWKRDFLDTYTWRGYLTMIRKMKNFKEPGKTYAYRCAFFQTFGILLIFFTVIMVFMFRLILWLNSS